MEIHTPDNQSFDAGHTLNYLEKVVNTIWLDKSSIDPHETMPETFSVVYLDYVMIKEAKEDSENSLSKILPDGGSPFSRANDNEDYAVMGLRVYQKKCAPDSYNIKCATMDPSISIYKHITNDVFERLLFLSENNKIAHNDHFPTGLDVQLSGDAHSDKRRIIARILSCSSMIATGSRRGPASFIMIGKEYMQYLQQDIPENTPFISIDSIKPYLGGLDVFVSSNLGSTVIVGRKPSISEEPGLHIVTTTKDISGKLNFTDNDISDVDVSYTLVETGVRPEKNYMQFNILDHVEG